MRIGLFGTGRVATALGPALVAAGHALIFVAGRTPASALALAALAPGCVALSLPLAQALPPADLYLLAVPDAAVPNLLAAVAWPSGALVAHLAGALPVAVFAAQPQVRGGVLYPLQTFSPGRAINWPAVPLFVEAPDAAAEVQLLALAHSLSQHVARLDSAQRLRLHLGAVFASNFTNHVLGIAHQLLGEAGLSFDLLAPLVRETVDKALGAQLGPFAVQTGPAARHDTPTLAAHAAALVAHPAWQTLYTQLTQSIQAAEAATVARPLSPA
ncbi:DUF2520 domain-containing protein [Hymenobacter setariae]|uniref:DUF2520 domain-containing protein n=1 Tax=Hymenobacter setariae TaxID=2594794 RepID=A0A558BVQ9_9BACT|nr:Rossmann-like and DUF2520 domain-containing protein [Hymenobacter setariae]TVT40594.1 DUF2520 domain-containing protein [Hymenobacter setariae]